MKHFARPFLSGFFLLALLTLFGSKSLSQQKQKYNVAIFLYPGVELLDFAGPGEAFASTPDFRVYTLSVDGKELLSQGFVTVKPQYSIDDAPLPDIIVFPGGSIRESAANQKLLHWINSLVSQGTTVMSVCNGAGILAKTGLLNGLTVTTHHGFISGLREWVPSATVLEDIKYVDNGNIITTAGVSAGIDGALHVISRIKGRDVAKSVAFYMEYNRWKPEEGKLIYRNTYLVELEGQKKNAENESKAVNEKSGIIAQIPYEGELKNLGMELLEKEQFQQAANTMEQAVKWYPYSASSYNLLSKAYSKLGKPAPVDEDEFLNSVLAGKVDEASLVYEKTQKNFPGWQIFEESSINMAGYHLLLKENFSAAIKVFLLNIKAFPNSWNAWDSLAEAYMKAANKMEAISCYRKSLELNPQNDNAKAWLTQLASK